MAKKKYERKISLYVEITANSAAEAKDIYDRAVAQLYYGSRTLLYEEPIIEEKGKALTSEEIEVVGA